MPNIRFAIPAVLLLASVGVLAGVNRLQAPDATHLAMASEPSAASAEASPASPALFAVNAPLSRVFVQSYALLTRYSKIPVLMPAAGSMPQTTGFNAPAAYFSSGLPSAVVNMAPGAYTVILAGSSLPPWKGNEPYFLGNRTTFAITGALAAPGGPLLAWFTGGSVPASSSLSHLPGLPVALRSGVTGYLTGLRDIGGNGGSDTSVTWRLGPYLYQVTAPIMEGQGGRRAVLFMADHMALLTPSSLGGAVAKPFVFHPEYWVPPGKLYQYTELLTLTPDLARLPAIMNQGNPTAAQPPEASRLLTAGSGSGFGRGYAYRYQRTASVAAQNHPLKILVDSVRGQVLPGSRVKVSGVMEPGPGGPIAMTVNWVLTGGGFNFHNYPLGQPNPYWDSPNNVDLSTLTNVTLNGTHFQGWLTVPRGIYDPGQGETNRFAVFAPGPHAVQFSVSVGGNPYEQGTGTASLDIGRGEAPLRPAAATGPYVPPGPVAAQALPPLSSLGLARLGVEGGMSVVPVLLPAWVPGRMAPVNPDIFVGVSPLTQWKTLPNGYAAIEFKAGVNERQGPKPAAWPRSAAQGQLVVYGVRGAPPFGRPAGRSVRVGRYAGIESRVAGGTLVRVAIGGANYGVFLAEPATASDALATARSLTEVSGPLTFSPANAVRAYAALIREERGTPSLFAGYSQSLWLRQASGRLTPPERRLDAALSSFSQLRVQIVKVAGDLVTARFLGEQKQAGKMRSESLEAVFQVNLQGQLALIKMIG